MRRLVIASLALAIAGPATSCKAPRATITPLYGSMQLDGEIGVDSSFVTARNSVEDLGLGDRADSPGAKVDLEFANFRFAVSGLTSTFSGDGVLSADVSSGGITIPATTPVSSELQLGVLSGTATFDFFPGDTIELGLGLGAMAIAADGRISDQTVPGNRVDFDGTIPLPLVVGRLGVRVWRLKFSAAASGMAIGYGGDRASVIDLEGLAELRLFGGAEHFYFGLSAGYRYMALDVEVGGSTAAEADLRYSGPIVGLTIVL